MKDTLGRENRKLADRRCLECGKIFRPFCRTSKYCSRPCAWKNNGKNKERKGSWWVNAKGYIEGRIWVNGVAIRVKQHRWVMEQHLGYPVPANTDVHHKNENKQDNRIENLELIPHGRHSTISNLGRKYVKGYKMNLSDTERKARSERAKKSNLGKYKRKKLMLMRTPAKQADST